VFMWTEMKIKQNISASGLKIKEKHTAPSTH